MDEEFRRWMASSLEEVGNLDPDHPERVQREERFAWLALNEARESGLIQRVYQSKRRSHHPLTFQELEEDIGDYVVKRLMVRFRDWLTTERKGFRWEFLIGDLLRAYDRRKSTGAASIDAVAVSGGQTGASGSEMEVLVDLAEHEAGGSGPYARRQLLLRHGKDISWSDERVASVPEGAYEKRRFLMARLR